MAFELKAARKRLEFREYAAEYGEGEPNHVAVQVNVSRELLGRMRASMRGYETSQPKAEELREMPEAEAQAFLRKRSEEVNARNEELFGVLSELWGAETWPAKSVRELFEVCLENDPQFWFWLYSRSFDAVFEHQGLVKKKQGTV